MGSIHLVRRSAALPISVLLLSLLLLNALLLPSLLLLHPLLLPTLPLSSALFIWTFGDHYYSFSSINHINPFVGRSRRNNKLEETSCTTSYVVFCLKNDLRECACGVC